MKVSRSWLNRFFEKPLPPVAEIADALTFHAFEIEEIEGETMEVKVLPDRAGYALSHRGIAYELSAILNIPMKEDPVQIPVPALPMTDALVVTTDSEYVLRHTGALVKGIIVGPSPAWLTEALESVGQRSINNIVDASNFVMLNIGQPTHAFDSGKITRNKDMLRIDIREANKSEKIKILTGEEYELSNGMYVIADGTSGKALDIAGVKGGFDSGITDATTDIFVSAGNYDGTLIRKMSQNLKIVTDASQRFQNRPSPELTVYGMRDLVALIQEVAGGEVIGAVDIYNRKPEQKSIFITAKKVTEILGAPYSDDDVGDVLTRLKLPYKVKKGTYEVEPPFERTDLVIEEDVVEEVGRIIGYDRVAPKEFTAREPIPLSDSRKTIEALRDLLISEGFNEISTYAMLAEGDVELAKPLADDKKFLRTNLAAGHEKAVKLNAYNLPLFNVSDLRMFEIGHVWPAGEEKLFVGITYFTSAKPARPDGRSGGGADKKRNEVFKEVKERITALFGKAPEGIVTGNTLEFDMHELTAVDVVPTLNAQRSTLNTFKMFSMYPFVLRDIAVWVPDSLHSGDVSTTIYGSAGNNLVRCDLFDSFQKDGRTSYAFHLVFQSYERTLSDEEVGKWMENVNQAVKEKGWEVR